MSNGFVFLIGIIVYILSSYPVYLLAKKADYDYAFFAFIPILNLVLMANIGGMNGLFILLALVPFVNIIFVLVLTYKFYDSYESGLVVFGISILAGLLAIIVPFITIAATIAIWWLALSDNQFIGEVWGKSYY